jgi:hypothetical protein
MVAAGIDAIVWLLQGNLAARGAYSKNVIENRSLRRGGLKPVDGSRGRWSPLAAN